MPRAAQDAFAGELERTLADPAADAQVKSAASYVLMHR